MINVYSNYRFLNTFNGVSSLFRQVYIPTGLYSDRSIFRQVYIPTGRYSDRSIFRQVDIPTCLYSNRSIFRQVVFPKVYIPTGRYSPKGLKSVSSQNFMLMLKFHFLNASDAAFFQNIAFCVFFSYKNSKIAILISDTV